MTPETTILMTFIKEWLWAPLLSGIAWAWKTNHDEHKALWKAQEKLKETTSVSYSSLNDRIMTHVDGRLAETIRFVRDEDAKIMVEMSTQRNNIAKLFDKLEDHGRHSENRHNELMGVLRDMTQSFHTALNQKADK